MINNRNDIVNLLVGSENIGIELGVAKGRYSKLMIDSGKFSKVYGIDRYTDHHDSKEYISAISYVGLNKPYVLIRSTFDEAITLFEDECFDFIYVDGYAHTGQEEGKTLQKWFSKLKKGGVFAGHDYHSKWPLTVKYVDNFVKENNLVLNKTCEENNEKNHLYPSWYVLK
jgi:hypothetical protein